MIRAALAMALIPLCGCEVSGKAPAPSADAVTVTTPVEAAPKPQHGAPKRELSSEAVKGFGRASVVFDAIEEAKRTVERRSYILDDRTNREMP